MEAETLGKVKILESAQFLSGTTHFPLEINGNSSHTIPDPQSVQ